MRIAILLLLPACLLISCNDSDTQIIDAGEFTIEIPENWVYEVHQGIDSYTAGIKMDKGQEAIVDLGYFANKLMVDAKTHDIVYETIDGRQAKVVTPKTVEKGTTGVYFEQVSLNMMVAFHISGTDLTRRNQEKLLDAIRSLRFKN